LNKKKKRINSVLYMSVKLFLKVTLLLISQFLVIKIYLHSTLSLFQQDLCKNINCTQKCNIWVSLMMSLKLVNIKMTELVLEFILSSGVKCDLIYLKVFQFWRRRMFFGEVLLKNLCGLLEDALMQKFLATKESKFGMEMLLVNS